MSSCDTLQKVKHDEGTDSDDEELDPESFAQQQSAAEATQGSETVSIETDVVTETMDEDDFLLELEAYNRRNNSRQRESIQQPIKVEQKPPPTIEDAEERAKAFQLARANKVKWAPNNMFFVIPEEASSEITTEMEEISWKELKAVAKFGRKASQSVVERDNFLGIASRGSNFMKYGRYGKPHIKILRLDPDSGKLSLGQSSLYLQDVSQIVAGKETKVFEGVKHKVAHPSCCFSVILHNRTINLQAQNESERNMWVQGLSKVRERLLAQSLDSDDDEDAEDAEFQQKFQKLSGGSLVFKYTRKGVEHERVLQVNTRTGVLDWGSGSISLCFSEVTAGKATKNFQGVNYERAPPQCCFSVVSERKTLDLRVKNQEDRDCWVKGLRELKNRLQEQRETELKNQAAAKSRKNEKKKTRRLSLENLSAMMKAADFRGAAAGGYRLIKHGQYGKPKSKIITVDLNKYVVTWASTSNSGKSGALNLRDAVKVVAGKETKLFAKVPDKVSDPAHCFSIVMQHRTLDLEAKNQKERDLWVAGLAELIKEFRRLDRASLPDISLNGVLDSIATKLDDNQQELAKAPSADLVLQNKLLLQRIALMEEKSKILEAHLRINVQEDRRAEASGAAAAAAIAIAGAGAGAEADAQEVKIPDWSAQMVEENADPSTPVFRLNVGNRGPDSRSKRMVARKQAFTFEHTSDADSAEPNSPNGDS
mmetsp:Transcript_972/g.1865  ORF Transcript_972/g.1865 Transcript_972/m.1865 type:complete len:708 (+) Transcript_972:26-2149(+)